jgi:hypothetical protein
MAKYFMEEAWGNIICLEIYLNEKILPFDILKQEQLYRNADVINICFVSNAVHKYKLECLFREY